jgi:hypothetical protein
LTAIPTRALTPDLKAGALARMLVAERPQVTAPLAQELVQRRLGPVRVHDLSIQTPTTPVAGQPADAARP